MHIRIHDREEQELPHIKVMVDELERLVQDDGVEPTTSVMTPAYWCARIHAAPDLPRSFVAQASVLLARLESLAAASRRS